MRGNRHGLWLDQSRMTSLYAITYDESTVGRALPEAIEIALRALFCENMSHTAAACKYIYIHNQSSCCLLIALLSYTDILWLFFLFVGFPRALCTLYSPNLNALLYQTVRKRKIQKKYFLYFKYKIHVLYFVTFSGTSILYFILIHLFEGYFVFCIKIHFDVFLPISARTSVFISVSIRF